MSKHLEIPAITSKFAIGETVFVKEGNAIAGRQIGSIKYIAVARSSEPDAVTQTEISYQLSGGYSYEESHVYENPYDALGIPNPYVAELVAVAADAPVYNTGDEIHVVSYDSELIPRNAVFMAYSPFEEGVVLVQYARSVMDKPDNDDDFDWVDYSQISRGFYTPQQQHPRKPKLEPSDVADAKAYDFQVNDEVRVKATGQCGVVVARKMRGYTVDLFKHSAHTASGPHEFARSSLELV